MVQCLYCTLGNEEVGPTCHRVDFTLCSTLVTYICMAQKWSQGIRTGILVSLLPVQCTDGFLPAEWLCILPMYYCQNDALPKERPCTWNYTHLGAWAWKTELTPLSLNNAEIHVSWVGGRLSESLPNCQSLYVSCGGLHPWLKRKEPYSHHAGGSRWLWGIPCTKLEKVLRTSEKHKNQANWILPLFYFILFLVISCSRETLPHFFPSKIIPSHWSNICEISVCKLGCCGFRQQYRVVWSEMF